MKSKVIRLAAAGTATMMLFFAVAPMGQVEAAKAKFTAKTKSTSGISVKKVEYDYDDSDDSIEIDFKSKIKVKSKAKVTVKDSSGKTYKAFIEDKDSDELDIDVANLKAGESYVVTISGIKKANASKYGTLTVNFSIPEATTDLVKEVDTDVEDREVTFEFANRVKYKNLKVTITDANGSKTYKTRIEEKENDELTVVVSGLKRGATYQYKITGVTPSGATTSSTLTGTFKAIED